MTKHDEQIPELPEPLRSAAREYNKPPELSRADYDDMWSAIEAKAFTSDIGGRVRERKSAVRVAARRWFAPRAVLPIAATLLLGIALGRATAPAPNALPAIDVPRSMTQVDVQRVPAPYQATTSRYLGQTAALLVSLPAEVRADGPADAQFIGRAHDLLLTTRMLMDSPAADDGRIRSLLEDLELVLAQVVRIQSGPAQGKSDMELIRQALEQRDVMPRLRHAVADIAADN